jgi:hypothetical protein
MRCSKSGVPWHISKSLLPQETGYSRDFRISIFFETARSM